MSLPTTSGRDLGLARLVFAAIMGLWLLYPVLELGRYAQDAIPLVVAGELAPSKPDALYVAPGGGIFDAKPEFFDASCRYYDTRAECHDFVVAFVSPPAALPLVVPLSRLGDHAFIVMREIGAVALVAAMIVLWRRLTPIAPRAAWSLAIASVLLTPLMTAPISLGQSSPLLFLAAVIPITVVDRRGARRVAFGVLMGFVGALKAFPVAVLAIPAVRRHWRVVVWSAVVFGVLALVSLTIAPSHLWGDFLSRSAGFSKESAHDPHNSSLEAALGQIGIDSGPVAWLVRAALAVPVVVVARRVRDIDVWWACSWAVMLVVFPQVWGHYSFVVVAAVAAVLVWRTDRERWLWTLPAVAALTIPIAVVSGSGNGAPLLQFGCNLAALAVVMVVAAMPMDASRPRFGNRSGQYA